MTSIWLLLLVSLSWALLITFNLSNPNNQIPINPLITPQHIIPEWYFLYLYSLLKLVPSKMGGILLIVLMVISLWFWNNSFYFLHSYTLDNINVNTYIKLDSISLLLISYLFLTFIGLQLPIAPFIHKLMLLLYLPIPLLFYQSLKGSMHMLFPLVPFGSPAGVRSFLFLLPSVLLAIPIRERLARVQLNTSSKPLSILVGDRRFTVGYISLLSSTNHKRIGIYYFLLGSYLSLIGIILSVIIRVELSIPISFVIVPTNISVYNLFITLHGLLMLLFIVMPILFSAIGNYFLVLTIGLLDIPYPRMNNLGVLVLSLSSLGILTSLLTEYLTGTGWTLYPPLTTYTVTQVLSSIFVSLILSGFSSLTTAINYFLLIYYWLSLPDLLFISYISTSLMVLYTIPILAGAFLLAISDIWFLTNFFSNFGGDPILYQHLFWFFGHPEVYILILPSFGLINYSLSQLTAHNLFGAVSMILALVSIMLFGSLVWVHHMFTVNIESDTALYFSILTLIIAIPTGTKLYNWLSLLFSHEFTLHTPQLIGLFISYLFIFIIIQGGVTGVVLGNNMLDIQLHDTYFVVSHFHFILSIGSVLSILLSLYTFSNFVSPLQMERNYNSRVDINTWIILFLLLNTIFIPMYLLGFNTLPRRVIDYSDILYPFNYISSTSVIALYLFIVSLLFV